MLVSKITSMDKETFGQRLKRLREATGLSQRQLASAAGIGSHASISLAERGIGWDRIPSPEITKPLAKALHVPHNILIGIDDDSVLVTPPRRLTETDLYERFGIKPYEQPLAIEGIAVSAGSGAGVPQDIDYTIPRRVKGSRYLWEAPVIGKCMVDDILPGEVVIYSTRLSAEIGRIMVALRDEEELIIKRLKLVGDKQVLRPNQGEDVPVDDRIRFLGRGVSVQRPLL